MGVAAWVTFLPNYFTNYTMQRLFLIKARAVIRDSYQLSTGWERYKQLLFSWRHLGVR